MGKSLGIETEMSFMEHMEELRWHIIRAVVALFIFAIASFVVAPWIFEHIIFAPSRVDFPTFRILCSFGKTIGSDGLCVQEIPFKLQNREMTGQFSMHIMASFIIGLIVSFPYIIWELYRFIKPGLHRHELKYSRGAVGWIAFLFLSGVLFGFFVLCPMMIAFLANYQVSNMIVNEFDISSYVGTLVTMILMTGLLFQLPMVILFLTNIGMLTSVTLRKKRKHFIIGILVLGAVITPTADPISQALISLPVYFLFEISVIIARRVEKRKSKEAELTNLAEVKVTS